MRSKISYWILSAIILSLAASGCQLLFFGGAATAGYKLSTDQKTLGEAVDDSMITASVKTRLIEDPYVRALNIDVDTNLGEVTLSGIVGSQDEKERAVTIAKGAKGVKNVTSLLIIRPIK